VPDEINGRITSALLVQELAYIRVQLAEVNAQLATAAIDSKGRDNILSGIKILLRDYKKMEQRVDFMYPWVVGFRWFAIIAGGLVAVAIIGGVFWAVAQSGGLLP